MVKEGDVLTVGTPMLKIASDEAAQLKPLTKEDPGTPIMERRRESVSSPSPPRPLPLGAETDLHIQYHHRLRFTAYYQ